VAQIARPLSTEPPQSETAPQKSAVREYIEAFVIALALAVILRTFFVQAYKIPSGSMEPTLLIGDHIIVNKLSYGLRMPDSFFGLTPFAGSIPYGKYLFRLGDVHRGDIIVFVFIKRVVGIPGDRVEVRSGKLFLNGAAAIDPHAHFEIPPEARMENNQRDNFGPLTVPTDEYFMMGDNRDRSYDSRFWGPISRDAVEGRARFIYWSCADENGLFSCFYDVRWGRLFHPVR
jgi:signal peptidase I